MFQCYVVYVGNKHARKMYDLPAWIKYTSRSGRRQHPKLNPHNQRSPPKTKRSNNIPNTSNNTNTILTNFNYALGPERRDVLLWNSFGEFVSFCFFFFCRSESAMLTINILPRVGCGQLIRFECLGRSFRWWSTWDDGLWWMGLYVVACAVAVSSYLIGQCICLFYYSYKFTKTDY